VTQLVHLERPAAGAPGGALVLLHGRGADEGDLDRHDDGEGQPEPRRAGTAPESHGDDPQDRQHLEHVARRVAEHHPRDPVAGAGWPNAAHELLDALASRGHRHEQQEHEQRFASPLRQEEPDHESEPDDDERDVRRFRYRVPDVRPAIPATGQSEQRLIEREDDLARHGHGQGHQAGKAHDCDEQPTHVRLPGPRVVRPAIVGRAMGHAGYWDVLPWIAFHGRRAQ